MMTIGNLNVIELGCEKNLQ